MRTTRVCPVLDLAWGEFSMSLPLVSDAASDSFVAGSDVLPIPFPSATRARTTDSEQARVSPQGSIFALHLVNGEHYSGAERVQDLLARQLPRYGCEVGFACVKPRRFPSARET